MKKLSILLLSFGALLAAGLQDVPPSFSTAERKLLFKELQSSSSIYTKKNYKLNKGWNKLVTPQDGVNVSQTFNDASKVEFVVTYDHKSELWAAYATDKNYNEDQILFLRYLEPNITFFVLAKKDAQIEIKSNVMSESCQKVLQDDTYDFVIDTGITTEYETSKEGSISLQSRYFSHHDRGVYNDTRIVMIYKKEKAADSKRYKYGPARPKLAVNYSKEHEGQKFYVYDYKEQKCFIGVFPSRLIPPMPMLKEI